MLKCLHVPRKYQFLQINSYIVNINTIGSNKHANQINKVALVMGARHAREARVIPG